MNTVILEKMGNIEEVRVDVFSRLLQNRVIFIDDLFNDKATIDILATLMYLDKDNKEKITLFINSEGGELRNIFMIYDAIKLMTSVVETFCIGSAMREAALILSAGTKGHRLITKNSDVCISQVISQYMNYGDLTSTKISHEKTVKDNDVFLKELSKTTGKSLKDLKKDTERQMFLTPTQAVEYGIADKVV